MYPLTNNSHTNPESGKSKMGADSSLLSPSKVHVVEGDKGNGMTLTEKEHGFWRRALTTDDHDLVASTLEEADEKGRQRLMNGHFLEDQSKTVKGWSCRVLKDRSYKEVSFRRPWCLAGASGSLNVLSVLQRYGVDVHQKDEKGSNILHLLVYLAFLDPTLEESCGRVYDHLQGILNTEDLQKLLKSEGHHQLYPLEMSAWLSTFGMLQKIASTEGIYRHSEQIDGVYTIDKYDVTEYETKERRNASPLAFLLFMDDKKTPKPETRAAFESGLIQNWLHLKTESSKFWIIFWILLRLIYVFAYMLYETAGGWARPGTLKAGNSTQSLSCDKLGEWMPNTVYLALTMYLMVHSGAIVLMDIAEVLVFLSPHYRRCTLKYYKTPNGKKASRSSYIFYRLSQSTMAVTCLLGTCTAYVSTYSDLSVLNGFTNSLYVLMSLNIIWSILLFIQLMPLLGYFVFCIQCMMFDLVKFAVIFLAFSYTYSTSFAHLVNEDRTESCSERFANPLMSFYTTFTAMVNMVDFHSFHVKDESNLLLLHVLYIFMVAILLLNFLIAQFSASVSHVLENKSVYTTVQWLSILCTIDFRIDYLNINWIDRRKGNYFLEENGRIFVPVASVNPMMDCNRGSD